MAAVAVQSIANEVGRWITSPPGGIAVKAPPTLQLRSSSGSAGVAPNIFVSYAAATASDFARAVVARLRLERPHLRVAMESEDERLSGGAVAAVAVEGAAGLLPAKTAKKTESDAHAFPSACATAGAVLVALTTETFDCPVVLRDIATCLGAEGAAKSAAGGTLPRLAFVYNVRSGRGEDPGDLVRRRAPRWLQDGMEGLGKALPCAPSTNPMVPPVPIFEYVHEYDDMCVSAVLQWLDQRLDLPSNGMLARLHHGVRNAVRALRAPEDLQLQRKSAPPQEPPRTLPPVTGPRGSILGNSGNSMSGNDLGLALSTSPVKSAPRGLKAVAVGLLFDPLGRGPVLASDAMYALNCAFGGAVKTGVVGGKGGVVLESVANLLVMITPGAFRCDSVVQTLTRALRLGGVNILLLQDVCMVPNIWSEFEALPEAIRPAIVSIIAVPYLQSHGFSACLARLAGTELLRPVACAEAFAKPAAAQYGRASTSKIFDLFLCHFQRTGLDWAFALRLSFVQHAGVSFKTFLDVQSLQNINECGRFVEQSHAIAVLVTRGIFTRSFCQQELLFARRAGVQIIFIQHMRTCIDIEEELDRVRSSSDEFMATHGEEYARAGGKAAHFEEFQHVLFEQIWTPRFRPPVFAYVHELEEVCIAEVVGYLRNRRARRSSGVEQLDRAARALLDFLRMTPEDRTEVRSGLAALANQAAAGNGDDFCAALVRVNAMPIVAEGLQRHGRVDGGIAYQALRALRSSAKTSNGQAALAQFVGAEGALEALHEVMEAYREADDAVKFRREALEVLRALRLGGPAVQLAVRQADLEAKFDAMFRRLNAELEPLDVIREQLDLAPVQLAQLEFALGNWRKLQTGGTASLPAEVQRASELLMNIHELRQAVATDDGERAEVLLREHLPDVERCAGVEALLREARSLSQKFRDEMRLRNEQLRTEAEKAKARRDAQERLEELLAQAAESPAPSLLPELEEAIVTAHHVKCAAGVTEHARETLEHLRRLFDAPLEFLASIGHELGQANSLKAVLALLSSHRQDRVVVSRCFEVAATLVEEQATEASLVKRLDVCSVLDAMEAHVNDIEVQTAGCACLETFLRATRLRHSAVSARALVEHPNSGDIASVGVVVGILAVAQRDVLGNITAVETTCRCLAELARLGESVVKEMKRTRVLTRVWKVIKLLGPEGRLQHKNCVALAVSAFEEMARLGGIDRSWHAIGTLLKLCDIYDSEATVCYPALHALDELFSERADRAAVLCGQVSDCDDPGSPASPRDGHNEGGLAIVFRNMHLHGRDSKMQEVACRIIGTAVGYLCTDSARHWEPLADIYCSRAVQLVIATIRMHGAVAPACEAAFVSLVRLVDFVADSVSTEVVRNDGVEPIVAAMSMQTKVVQVQQCGLKVLSLLIRRYPHKMFGEDKLLAIVTAMRARPDDALTQFYGCAALRSLAEQGAVFAHRVCQAAAPTLFTALLGFPGDLLLYSEALRVLELTASASAEIGRQLGEEYEAVPKILEALPALLSKEPRRVAGTGATAASSTGALEACLTACRTLRAICVARAAAGISYERLFHAGVCKGSGSLADLLIAFPTSHDIQIETLDLICVAAIADDEGARFAGSVLAQATSASSPPSGCNLVLAALERFHSDTDCVVVFELLSKLALSDDFVTSFTAAPHGIPEVLRWTAIFRDDALVQSKAVKAILAFLRSATFDPDLLVNAEGVEALLLAAARHAGTSIASEVPLAFVELVGRSRAGTFFAALGATLRRHVSNASVIGAACSMLRAVFQGDEQDADRAEHRLRGTGAMSALLDGVLQHQQQRCVTENFPPLVDLVLRSVEMRDLLVARGVAPLLANIVHSNVRLPREDQPRDWFYDVTLSLRHRGSQLEHPTVAAAAFRVLQRMLSIQHWHEIEMPELVGLLLRTMNITEDRTVLAPAAGLLAGVLRLIEEQVTWTACGAGPKAGDSQRSLLAAMGRRAHDAEVRGLRQWRSGNFLPAAADFRAADAALASAAALVPDAKVSSVIAGSLNRHRELSPLAEFARVCEEQHRRIQEQTAAARTRTEVSCTQGADDCPICLEQLSPQAGPVPLWKCEQCGNCMHDSCVLQWRQRAHSCPLCRRRLDGSVDTSAYDRARDVAVAAEACLSSALPPPPPRAGLGSRRAAGRGCASNATAAAGQPRSGVAERHGEAFLAFAVASLWRASARIGEAVGVDADQLQADRERAAVLEARGAETVKTAATVAQQFQDSFVRPCEAKAATASERNSSMGNAVNVVETLAVEVAQHRCAVLADDAQAWTAEAKRLQMQSRFEHADQLLVLVTANLTKITELAPVAGLEATGVHKQLDEIQRHRQEIAAQRVRTSDDSTGHVAAPRRPRAPLTPFSRCLAGAWDRSGLPVHVMNCVHALATTSRASRALAGRAGAAGSNQQGTAAVARRIQTSCDMVVDAILQDRVPAQIAANLEGSRQLVLLAIAFFQQLLHCGHEASQASFGQIDAVTQALMTQRHRADTDLQACLCSLLHDLVFGGGSEERMVKRLQREAAPRTATTLEEWFLDTLLVQHGAEAFRHQILLPSQVEAWLLCSSGGGGGLGVGG